MVLPRSADAPEQKIEFETWEKVRGTELKKYEAVALLVRA
jgi:hypothetical protein